MHSYIEGICLELGNFNDYLTYTADPSATYRDNLKLSNISTIHKFPEFSYTGIINEAKRIDVIWFNKKGYTFPKRVFEVVDSVATMNSAFNRSLQLKNFITDFVIVAPEKHRRKYNQTIDLEIYQPQKDRFSFVNYDEIIALYDATSQKSNIERTLFG